MYFLLPFILHCEDEKTIMMKNGSVLPGARVPEGVTTYGMMMLFWGGGTLLSPDCGGEYHI